jgi:antitoxin ParD1/3/4
VKVPAFQFSSSGDVLRDAVRLAANRDVKIERLQQLVREGEESGPARAFDFDRFIAEQFSGV